MLTTILLGARAFLSGFVTFVVKHWRVILIAIVFALYSYSVYNYGYTKCDDAWIKYTNAKVAVSNAQIQTLEHESISKSEVLDARKSVLHTGLDTVLTENRGRVRGVDAAGKTLVCNGQSVDGYLSSDFVRVWNSLNQRGNE